MAEITLSTARFGEVTIDDTRILRFERPILGFDASQGFVLLDHAEDSPFKWLQSVDEPELAFVVTNPRLFGIEYEFSIPDDVVSELGIQKADDVLVLTIVNIPPSNPTQMTANLLGPLIVNQENKKAIQLVLSESEYSTKVRLLPDELTAKEQTPSTASKKKGE